MNRRGFLQSTLAGVIGFGLDPERALWIPGQRTHVLPPAGGWRGDGTTVTGAWCGLQKGDVFTIAGVYAVNPVTLTATQHPQFFVVTADVTGPTVDIAPVITPRPNEPVDFRRVQSLFVPPLKAKDRGGWNHRRNHP